MRAFFAIDLSSEIKNSIGILIKELAFAGKGIKWVGQGNLHVTLKFLGEVEDGRLAEIFYAVNQAAGGSGSFKLKAGTLGFFPGPKRPKVLWAGITEGGGKVSEIYAAIEKRLFQCGFPKEEKESTFVPHITIGRIKTLSVENALIRSMEEKKGIPFGSMEADRIVIMKSVLGKDGPQYSPVYEIYLKK